MRLQDFKNYLGDVNLEYGGTFFDFSEWKYDYVPALRITDLDSACGFTGAVMVERLTVIVPDDRDKLESILSCIGESSRTDKLWDSLQSGNVEHSDKMLIAYAALAYGLYDPDGQMYEHERPKFYQSSKYTSPYMLVVQTVPPGEFPEDVSMDYDGWTADVRLGEGITLFEYLLDNGYLSEFE